MSITNFISDENMTIVQGTNGIRLFEENWVVEKRQKQSKERQNQKQRIQQERNGKNTP